MTNDNGTKSVPVAIAVTLSSDNTELTGTVPDKLKWNVTSSSNGYKFFPNGQTDKCLYNSSKTTLKIGNSQDNNSYFKPYSEGTYSGLQVVSSERVLVVNDNKQWKAYSLANNKLNCSIAYYKLISSTPAKTATSLTFTGGDKVFYMGDGEGTAFTQTATLNPAVEGAKITYSSSNEDVALVDGNTGDVLVSTGKEGTATITATYAGNATYAPSKASYTIAVEHAYQNIAELKAAYNNTEMTAALRLANATVTCVDGKNHYLQDATGALNVYLDNFPYVAGDVLNGIASVTYTLYNGLPEITAFTAIGEIAKTSGDAPAPTEMSIADAQKDENLCKYVVIKNVTVAPDTKAGYATAKDQKANSITAYKKNRTYDQGQYDLTGIVSVYGDNKQIAFIGYAPDFEIDEDAANNAITAGSNGTVTFSRTFNNGAWNTLVLPFAMTAEQLSSAFGDKALYAEYTGTTQQADGSYTLNFTKVSATKANTPVFVWGAQNAVATVSGVDVVKADVTSAPANAAFSFTGSYDKTTVQQGDWFISPDNKVYRAAGTESIKPMRAVFRPVAATTESAAKKLSFSIDGGQPTAIAAMSAQGFVPADQTPACNLAGQRVNRAYKGLVIRNGKKYVSK